MPNKFIGKLDDLKDKIHKAGIRGVWTDQNEKYSFRSEDGGVLNWWPRTQSLSFQGSSEAKAKLESIFLIGESGEESKSDPRSKKGLTSTPKQIFIVHGHDSDARDQLELALHRLGLKPFILMNASGGGKTIIEALEGKIGRDYTSDFGLVLMTPDDFGYSKKDGDKKVEPRARQNVVLEAGMLLASLTRSRIAIIVKGHLELPSDLQGIIHLAFNDHIREIVPKLCQRLKDAGFQIDSNQIASATQ